MINTITADCDLKLRKYKLSEADWGIARELRGCSQGISLIVACLIYNYNSFRSLRTLLCFFSQGTPSIVTIIPAIDHINKYLATSTTNQKYPLAIKASIAIRKKNP